MTREGEVSPGMLVPVLAANKAGEKAVFPMICGYHFDGIKRAVANARSETAAEKPSFREGWEAHRCIIPASWYYEWEHIAAPGGRTRPGDKYAILPKGGEVTWLCGVYRLKQNFPHFVILTREPDESISFIHDRMPLILPEEAVAKWIDPNVNPHRLLAAALMDMAFEKDAGRGRKNSYNPKPLWAGKKTSLFPAFPQNTKQFYVNQCFESVFLCSEPSFFAAGLLADRGLRLCYATFRKRKSEAARDDEQKERGVI